MPPEKVPGEPYDVFLAVCFGFCYASALLPLARMLECEKCGTPHRPNVLVIVRGILTVIGLGCLYGWYEFYLRYPYDNHLPPLRLLLDWVSLGLFAVGANWWDKHKNPEGLYYYVEASAMIAFGITCASALYASNLKDSRSIPLYRGLIACVILLSSFAFYKIMLAKSKVIFGDTRLNGRSQASKMVAYGFGMFFIHCGIAIASLAIYSQFILGVDYDTAASQVGFAELGIWFAFLLSAYASVGYAAVRLGDSNGQDTFWAVITTCIPMATLIMVTIFSSEKIFLTLK